MVDIYGLTHEQRRRASPTNDRLLSFDPPEEFSVFQRAATLRNKCREANCNTPFKWDIDLTNFQPTTIELFVSQQHIVHYVGLLRYCAEIALMQAADPADVDRDFITESARLAQDLESAATAYEEAQSLDVSMFFQ